MKKQKRYQLNPKKFLDKDEQKELEGHILEHWDRWPAENLAILLALKTGARIKELLNVKFEDINTKDRTIFFYGLKGSSDREIPIPKRLFDRLYQHIQRAQKNTGELVFPFTQQHLGRKFKFYCNKKFHSLRHTFAMNLFVKRKDIRLVQVALGHRSINNTIIYAEYYYSKEELRRLIV